MTAIKPMLAKAAPEDLSVLTYPLLVQPKFDGIRALIVDGVVQSRSGKPIPNKDIQARYGRQEFNGLDGELLVGDPRDPNAMQNTSTIVMAPDKSAYGCVFHVFDKWDHAGDYTLRAMKAAEQIRDAPGRGAGIVFVQSEIALNADMVETWEAAFVDAGYEGAILRADAPYKHGRSGSKGPLLKLKRFIDFEAVVIGVEERMHNQNERKRDAFGRTERSTAKAGLVPAGDLGKLVCRALNGPHEGQEFGCGTGFTAEQRKTLWDLYLTTGGAPPLGRIVKVKSFPVGVKDAPRFPTFLGFRDPLDMGE